MQDPNLTIIIFPWTAGFIDSDDINIHLQIDLSRLGIEVKRFDNEYVIRRCESMLGFYFVEFNSKDDINLCLISGLFFTKQWKMAAPKGTPYKVYAYPIR